MIISLKKTHDYSLIYFTLLITKSKKKKQNKKTKEKLPLTFAVNMAHGSQHKIIIIIIIWVYLVRVLLDTQQNVIITKVKIIIINEIKKNYIKNPRNKK